MDYPPGKEVNVKLKELNAALRLIDVVLADLTQRPVCTKKLQSARREFLRLKRSGKLEPRRLLRAVALASEFLLEERQATRSNDESDK